MLGSGPRDWAVSAKCQARAGPDEKWGKAVIEGISLSGNFLVEWLPSARESCHEVTLSPCRFTTQAADTS